MITKSDFTYPMSDLDKGEISNWNSHRNCKITSSCSFISCLYSLTLNSRLFYPLPCSCPFACESEQKMSLGHKSTVFRGPENSKQLEAGGQVDESRASLSKVQGNHPGILLKCRFWFSLGLRPCISRDASVLLVCRPRCQQVLGCCQAGVDSRL